MGHGTPSTQRTGQKLVQITLSNALDQSEKRLIDCGPSQSIRQAVVDAGMAPSSQFDVFSSVGEVVTNRQARDVNGETLYVGPARIAGGSNDTLTIDRMRELSVDFPTLLPVHEMIHNGQVQMFTIKVPMRLPQPRTKNGFYHIAIHCPNPANQMPAAYVLNHQDVTRGRFIMPGGSSGAQYDHSTKKLPGTNKDAWWVCNGNYGPTYMAISNDIVSRLSGFINHTISVLNS
jgi:hypothetical protein